MSAVEAQPFATTPTRVIAEAVRAFGYSEADLRGPEKWRPLVEYRQVTQYVIRQLCSCSYPTIARMFGGRDHTSVMHSVRKVEESLALQRLAQTLAFEVQMSDGGSFS